MTCNLRKVAWHAGSVSIGGSHGGLIDFVLHGDVHACHVTSVMKLGLSWDHSLLMFA
jgi:hypothetical protein